MNNKKSHKQAAALKFAAVVIAAPRYIGAFGANIGIKALELVPGLAYAEMGSGFAMALLEGFALAFILGKLRLLNPASHQYKTLHRFAWGIALTLPVIGLPYLLSEQQGVSISSLFANGWLAFSLQVLWSLTTLIAPVLVVMAVGYADVDETERDAQLAEQAAIVRQVELEQEVAQAAQVATAKQKKLLIKQDIEQAASKPFACAACPKSFGTAKGLDGHQAHCPGRANGKQKVLIGEDTETTSRNL